MSTQITAIHKGAKAVSDTQQTLLSNVTKHKAAAGSAGVSS